MRLTRGLAMLGGASLVATLAVGGGFPSVPEAVAAPGDTYAEAITQTWDFEMSASPLHDLARNTSTYAANGKMQLAPGTGKNGTQGLYLAANGGSGNANLAYKAGYDWTPDREYQNFEFEFDLKPSAGMESQIISLLGYATNPSTFDSGLEFRIGTDEDANELRFNEYGGSYSRSMADTKDDNWHTWKIRLENMGTTPLITIYKDGSQIWQLTDFPANSLSIKGNGFAFAGWRHGITVDNITFKAWGLKPALPDAAFTLNRATSDITVGDSTSLSPMYDQATADWQPSYVWTSSDTSVATVTSTGIVTGVGAGTATITATSNGETPASASATVNVKAAAAGLYLYVSPDGDDATGDGTQTNPFKTVQGARDYIRTLRPLPAGGVTVYLARAWYYTDEAITFEPQDSGEPGAPIVYTTEPGTAAVGEPNQATIHSARSLTGWRALTDADNPLGLPEASKEHVLVIDVEPGWTPRDLYVEYTDGQPAERQQVARQFNTDTVSSWHVFPKSDSTIDMRVQRLLNDADTKGMEIPFVTGDLVDVPSNGDAEVVMNPEVWNMAVPVITDVQLGGTDYLPGYQTARLGSFTTSTTPGYWLNGGRTSIFSPYGGGTYNIQNAPKFLDQAGEWCVDSAAGKIYWWPKGNLTAAQVNGDKTTPALGIVAPHATSLIEVQGDDDAPFTDLVQYLEFRNLAFMYTDRLPEDSWDTDTTYPELGGYEYPYSMINLTGSDHVVLADNAIGHSGSGGITFEHYAQNNLVLHNEVFDVNSIGLNFKGYYPNVTLHVNQYNVALGNTITDTGQMYGHAPGVNVWGSSYLDFKYNHIDGTPYNGVTVGAADPGSFLPDSTGEPIDCMTYEGGYHNTYGGCFTLGAAEKADLIANADPSVWKEYGSIDRRQLSLLLSDYYGLEHNIVEYNYVERYGTALSDGGAYYTWSGGLNNQFDYNIAYKSASTSSFWMNALYADDMALYQVWHGNVGWNEGMSAPTCVGPISPCTRNDTGIGIKWTDNTLAGGTAEPAEYTALKAKMDSQWTALGGEAYGYVADHIPNEIPNAGLLLDVSMTESGPVDANGHKFKVLGNEDAQSMAFDNRAGRWVVASENITGAMGSFYTTLTAADQDAMETAFTAEVYMNLTLVPSGTYTNVWGSQQGGGFGYEFYAVGDSRCYDTTKVCVQTWFPAGGSQMTPRLQTSIEVGEWIDLVFAWDGTNAQLYKNGVLVDSGTKTGLYMWPGNGKTAHVCSDLWFINADCGGGPQASNTFTGSVSDAKLFWGALTAEQIEEIYENRVTQGIAGAIKSLPALTETDYTTSTWAGLEDLNDAVKALTDASTKTEIEDALEAYYDKVDALEKRGDTSYLNVLTAAGSVLDASPFTDTSADAFQDALDAALAIVADNSDSNQAAVDAALADLQAAITGLTLKPTPVNKSGLDSIITAGDGLKTKTDVYTAASLTALSNAIDDANDVLADPAATQSDVDTARQAVQDAINALVVKPTPVNKAGLDAAIATGDSLKTQTSKYTAASLTALSDAVNSAKTVQASGSATQAQVDAAKAAVQSAINNLVVKTATATATPSPSSTPAPSPAATKTATPTPAGPKGYVTKYESFVLSPDLSGDGRGEILAVSKTGALDMHSTSATGTITGSKTLVASGESGKRVYGPGDWNSDKANDIVSVDKSGNMFLRIGYGGGGVALQTQQIGHGWSPFRIIPAGDLTSDGFNDMLAIDQQGRLWLYAGNGRGGWLGQPKQVGQGWVGLDLYAAGDLNGDGKNDILAILPDGTLWAYAGRGNGTFETPKKVGSGWGAFTLAAGADLNGDGRADIVGRNNATGELFYYQGNGGGSFQGAVKIATGW